MSIPPPLWDALNDSIFSGVFIDTKFVVFSERVKATGRIKQPRILFAASTVVKSVPYLASCGSGTESIRISHPFASRFHR